MKQKGLFVNLYHFMCYIALLIVCMPVVDYYCDWYITLLPFLVVFYRLAKYKSTLRQVGTLMGMAACFLVIQFWGVYRNLPFLDWMIEGLIVWMPCLFAIYMKQTDDKEFMGKYLQTMILFMTVTSVTTIIGLYQYPMAARELASGTAVYDTVKYTLQNIGGYSHIYALVVLIPVLIWMIKNTKRMWRITNMICMAINLFCIYKSQYTIAIIVGVIVLAVVLLHKFKKTLIVGLVAIVALFLIDSNMMVGFFAKVFLAGSQGISEEYVGDRLEQVSQLLEGVTIHTNTSADRIEHYQLCIEKIGESPIIGNNMIQFSEDNISGHSAVLDITSGLGMVGLAAVLYIFLNCFNRLFRKEGQGRNRTVLAVWLAFAAVSVLNPSGFMPIYMIIFVSCTCVQGLENQDENSMVV